MPQNAMYKTIKHHVGFTHAEFEIDRTKFIAFYAEGRNL